MKVLTSISVIVTLINLALGAPTEKRQIFSQQSSSFSNVGSSGNSTVKIIVSNGSIYNLNSGPGFISTSIDSRNGIIINVNGQEFKSNDIIGPYVVTLENGVLRRREMTKEDEEELRQRQQMMEQAMVNFNNQMNLMMQNLQNSLNNMNHRLSNMFSGMNMFSQPQIPQMYQTQMPQMQQMGFPNWGRF